MTKEETLNLLEAIKTNYQNFKIDEKVLNFWHFALRNMDYQKVSEKLMQHVMTKKFPPTIAEISVKKEPEERRNDFLRLTSEWEENAVGKPRS